MENDIRILIIEDEEMWVKVISTDLYNFGYTIAGTASGFGEALPLLMDTDNYDLVLVDIMLNGRTAGIEIGRLINTVYKKPFIFMTSTPASISFHDIQGAHPSAYLIKPVNPSSLVISIQNAIDNFDNKVTETTVEPQQSQFFFVKHGNKYKKISWPDVVYLRSNGNYTNIYNVADKTEYPVRSSLAKAFQFIIPPALQAQFVQVNRSEVVQTTYVTEFSGSDIYTKYGTFVCTDNFLRDIRTRLNTVV